MFYNQTYGCFLPSIPMEKLLQQQTATSTAGLAVVTSCEQKASSIFPSPSTFAASPFLHLDAFGQMALTPPSVRQLSQGVFPPSSAPDRGPRDGDDLFCKFCSNTFTEKAEYMIHYEEHMKAAKPYVCQFCAKRFAHSSYLQQHLRIHLGIRPYSCKECGRTFTQLSHLTQHNRIHSGIKPYVCKHCSKAFSQLSNLQTHSRVHQVNKPFRCKGCYKCFASETELSAHIPAHSKSKHLKINICPLCGMSYQRKDLLQKHVLDKHQPATYCSPITDTSSTSLTVST